jgi:hypothetical protein
MAVAAPRTGPSAPPAVPAPEPPATVRPWRALLAACLALSGLTLLTYTEPTYDPFSWINWGRQITELDLATLHGPSWKPLPVAFTTVFAFFGDAAPDLWVWIARASWLLAIALAFRLGSRFGGWSAGLVAATGLLFADALLGLSARGNSEGMLAAVGLWAVERHLDGRRGHAFALGFAAALLRPEVWPFWGLYGLWLARDPARRMLVAGLFAANAALWVLPEWWGSGQPFRAAERAQTANPGQPVYADFPFLEVLERSAGMVGPVVLAGAAVAVWHAVRARQTVVLALAAGTLALVVEVALMSEAGFAGNIRYVVPATGLACVLAGIGWARVHPLAAVAAAMLIGVLSIGGLADDLRTVRHEARLYGELPAAIEAAGGREAVRRCGRIYTSPFAVPAVAWYLQVQGKEVALSPNPPGTIFVPRDVKTSSDERFRKVDETAHWIVRSACAA